MGSPKKQRKKFSKPSHPWQKERILAEIELLKEYGLRRKFEIWKMSSMLKNFTRQAKNLITTETPQVEKEKSQLLTKLSSLGLTGKEAKIEDVLSLTLKDLMERRLQTLVFRKNLASTISQARQFIVHEHISLGDKTITAPSYLVPIEEEASLQFVQGSVISSTSHPIRAIAKQKKDAEKAKEKEAEKKAKEEKTTAKRDDTDKKIEKTVGKTKKVAEGKEDAGKSKNSGTRTTGTATEVIKQVKKENEKATKKETVKEEKKTEPKEK